MLLHCKVFNFPHTLISILFFTSPYNLFVFQSMITNWHLVFFFIYYLLLCICFFLYHLSLSLPIGNLSFSKIWWWFYDIKFALLVFFFLNFNLVFLTWFVLYSIFPLMHWVREWVFPKHYSILWGQFYLLNLRKILYV